MAASHSTRQGGREARRAVRFGSVCSGIEAASVAWEPLGWTPAFFSEIDPFASAVLSQRFPRVRNLGDMTKFREWADENFDVLVGGTPCQSFSVAGLRAGLADPRGNLALTFLAIVDRFKPRWVVWENVPGVLSSLSHVAPDPRPPVYPVGVGGGDGFVDTVDEYDGEELHAFQSFVAGLQEIGYGLAFRVLDAQHFGVPQRRRRVFVVGYLGDWTRAASVLFDGASVSRDSPPRRAPAEDTAPTLEARTRGGGGTGTDFEAGGGLVETVRTTPSAGSATPGPLVAGTLQAGEGRRRGSGIEPRSLVVGTLQAGAKSAGSVTQQDAESGLLVYGGGAGEARDVAATVLTRGRRGDFETDNLIAHALTSGGADASEDGTGRGTPLVYGFSAKKDTVSIEDTMPTIGHDQYSTPIAFGAKDHGGDAGDVAPTLRSMARASNTPTCPPPFGRSPASHGTAAARLAISSRRSRRRAGRAGKGDAAPLLAGERSGVRRITPREAERLQGFPDDWTLVEYANGEEVNQTVFEWGDLELAADAPRYRAVGNSMAVPVMRWIGRRIELVESVLREIGAADALA
jgi:DNA (cytosine-5)-methyltransferase 1